MYQGLFIGNNRFVGSAVRIRLSKAKEKYKFFQLYCSIKSWIFYFLEVR